MPRRRAESRLRPRSKLISVVVSLFTSHYVMRWPEHFGPATPLRSAPAFDGRVVRPSRAECLGPC